MIFGVSVSFPSLLCVFASYDHIDVIDYDRPAVWYLNKLRRRYGMRTFAGPTLDEVFHTVEFQSWVHDIKLTDLVPIAHPLLKDIYYAAKVGTLTNQMFFSRNYEYAYVGVLINADAGLSEIITATTQITPALLATLRALGIPVKASELRFISLET